MKGSDEAQVEQVTRIGAYLRQEREQRSISLESIAVKTYIPLRLLTALEQGQADKLPQAIFVQGFVRRYADAIGLDGMALSKTFVVEPSIVPLAATPQATRPMPPLPVPPDNTHSPARPTSTLGSATQSPQQDVASQPIPPAIQPDLSPNFTPDFKGVETTTASDSDAPEEVPPEPIAAALLPEPAIAHPPDLELAPLELSSKVLPRQDVLPQPGEAHTTDSSVPEPPAPSLPEPVPFSPPSTAPSSVPLPALKTSIYGTQTPQRTNSYLPFAILAAGAAVFLLAIASFFAYKPKPVTQTSTAPTTSPSSMSSGTAPAPSPTASPSATPGSMPVQVSMNLTEEAWVQITADGKVVFEGVQPKNFKKVWSAQKSLTIVSGNAGAVLLSSNQSPPKPMGPAGAVQELSFPPAAPVP